MINITNFTNIDWTQFESSFTGGLPECMNKVGKINIECMTRNLCSQVSDHYLKAGLIILCIYVLGTWGLWWFFNHGYKKIDNDYFHDLNKRIYWDTYIRSRMMRYMAVYIALFVFLQWRG